MIKHKFIQSENHYISQRARFMAQQKKNKAQNQQLMLDKKIQEAESMNTKLLNILEQLQKKVQNKIAGQEETQKSQKEKRKLKQTIVNETIIKNIDQRIGIYNQQLSKLNNNSSQDYITKIKEFEQKIDAVEKKTEEYQKQIKIVQFKLENMKTSNIYGIEHQNIRSYSENQYSISQQLQEIEKLRNKLQNLKQTHISTEKLKPRNKMKSMFLNIGQSEELPQFYHSDNSSKKSPKIDKMGLYKNLIKYYQNQEDRIKQDIKMLEKKKQEEDQDSQKLEKQITECEKKIKQLRLKANQNDNLNTHNS